MRLTTRFARPTRFALRPRALSRAERETQLGALKERLLRLHLDRVERDELRPVVQRAADEAASLAWATPYPLLVLPELVEEKVAEARERAERQARIYRETAALFAEAA